jgi:hypothetical protein
LPDGINGRFCKFIELKLDDTDTVGCRFIVHPYTTARVH